MLREVFGANAQDHLAVYFLASLANLSLSVPQFEAVSMVLDLGIHPQGTLISHYLSTMDVFLDSVFGILIFQGILAVLILGVSASASTQKWRWQYSLTSILVASYVAYHLGGKFLNVLGWIGVLETSGVNVSGIYGNLFWFGLLATICYFSMILFLRRSYGRISTAQQSRVP